MLRGEVEDVLLLDVTGLSPGMTFDPGCGGSLVVPAKERRTSREQRVHSGGACGLTREEISRMTTDAQAHPCR